MPSPSSDEFFVGYLATPRGLSRWLKGSVVVAMLVALAAAGVIASRQRDPGDGQWSSDPTQFTGTLVTQPYPMLQLDRGIGTLILVGSGKVAAELPAGAASGQGARVHGTVIERGTLRLLELDEPIEITSTSVAPIDPPTTSQRQRFRGEIVDPKCFAGAMKPGEGKTHKSCAALCLRGGIPPAFVSTQGELFIILSASGEALAGDDLDRAIALIGEPVSVTGVAETRSGVRFLKIDPATLQR